jgi:hypothetical protein
MKIERLAHPRYSSELSPSDFWFFGRAKAALQNRRFADVDAQVGALTGEFDGVIFEELQSMIQNWIERLEWVVRHNGEYFVK